MPRFVSNINFELPEVQDLLLEFEQSGSAYNVSCKWLQNNRARRGATVRGNMINDKLSNAALYMSYVYFLYTYIYIYIINIALIHLISASTSIWWLAE